MNTVKVLDELKEFLINQVANRIQLKCPDDNNATKYQLISPSVCVGWLPPKGYLPPGMESSIPCIIVGMNDGVDDKDEALLHIKLSFATYSPGKYLDEGSLYQPSFSGYVDLINIMDLTKAELRKNIIINGKYVLEDNFRFNMYEEQPYPYWYGYMTFSVKGTPYPMRDINKLL